MKPSEFWDSTYRELNIYTQVNLAKITDKLKTQINLHEAATNKLIKADSMSKRPKIELIRDNYKELFKQDEEEAMSTEEITRRMRAVMKAEKEKK